MNEELVTVNSELQTKIEQMAGMQDDLKHLLDNLRLGVIFLDRHLLIRRFTCEATKVFRLAASDIGRSLADIRSELIDADLLADAQVVLDSLVPTVREARSSHGEWVLARVQPCRTVANAVDGVVLTPADVTERVAAIAAREALALAEAIVDTVASPLVVLDGSQRVLSANRAFGDQFNSAPGGTVGLNLFDIGARRWDLPALRGLLQAPWGAKPGPEIRQLETVPADGSAPGYRFDARRIVGQVARGDVILLSITQATGAKAAHGTGSAASGRRARAAKKR